MTDSGGAQPGAGEPDAESRWRCGACGNLTRFDVVRRTTLREFWHLDLSGEPAIEETVALSSQILEVTCRWCERSDSVALVPRPGLA